MIDQFLRDAWRLLSRARGVGLVLRLLILLAPVAAVGCTALAAGRTMPALVVVIVGLTLACVLVPDSHLGLLVVVIIAVHWLATVDDVTTPWSLALAATLTVFHAALATTGAAPPSARWTMAMMKRWSLRVGAVWLAAAATWGAALAVDHFEVSKSASIVTSSLMVVALAGLWARSGTVERDG